MLSPFVVCSGLAQGGGGLGFRSGKSEQPHPAPVWPQLPLSRILILDYGYLGLCSLLILPYALFDQSPLNLRMLQVGCFREIEIKVFLSQNRFLYLRIDKAGSKMQRNSVGLLFKHIFDKIDNLQKIDSSFSISFRYLRMRLRTICETVRSFSKAYFARIFFSWYDKRMGIVLLFTLMKLSTETCRMYML